VTSIDGMIDREGVAYLGRIAKALERQADVMERDVPEEPEDAVITPVEISVTKMVAERWQNHVNHLGMQLEDIVVSYPPTSEGRIKATRSLINKMKQFTLDVDDEGTITDRQS